MSTVALPNPPALTAPPAPPESAAPPAARSPWLVGPWFDLLFFANITWPVIVLLAVIAFQYSVPEINTALGFYLAWLLATPHRWITLALVFLDRERFNQRPSAYLFIFLGFLAFTLVVASFKALALLIVIDFFWQAWHFGAQHSGISRIYGRQANPNDKSSGMFEKVVLRTFTVYVIVRLAGAPIMGDDRQRWIGWLDAMLPYLMYVDFPMLVLPAILLAREVPGLCRASMGRFIYLASVCLLYTGLLVGVHLDETFGPIHGGMLFAISIFHSTEYLAIVSWSVKKRHAKKTEGLFAYLAPRWGLALAVYMLTLGIGAWAIKNQFGSLWVHATNPDAPPERVLAIDQNISMYWLILTLFVSFLHYAYDGMIWKVRRPASASVA
jgi:hypothetical protein